MLYILKYIMKWKCFVLLQGLVALSAFSLDLTVSRISVTGVETTDSAVVQAAFVEVEVGDTLSIEQLTEAAERAQSRLISWGIFGSVEVLLIPSTSKPGTAALVATVSEGFPFRFGGGPIWGRFGVANLAGQGKNAQVWLGINKQALAYTDLVPGWRGGQWTVEAGNRPRSWFDATGKKQDWQAVGGVASLSQDWGWGWETGLAAELNALTDAAYRGAVLEALPTISLAWSRLTPGFSPEHGVLVRAEELGSVLDGWVRSRGDARAYLPLGAGFKTAFRVTGAVQTGGYAARDALLLSGLDGVRKAFDASDRGWANLWTSAELRWVATPSGILGLNVFWEPALFFDAGLAWDQQRTPLVWAGGLALRLFLTAPVFLPLRLEGSLDNQNRFQLSFGASAPFKTRWNRSLL